MIGLFLFRNEGALRPEGAFRPESAFRPAGAFCDFRIFKKIVSLVKSCSSITIFGHTQQNYCDVSVLSQNISETITAVNPSVTLANSSCLSPYG